MNVSSDSFKYHLLTLVRCFNLSLACIIGFVVISTSSELMGAIPLAKAEAAPSKHRKEVKTVVNVMDLEGLLADEDWNAVEVAKQLAQKAWPALVSGSRMHSFRSRQISMVGAGAVGGNSAKNILLSGLSDKHANVRIAAASQLSHTPPKNAYLEIVQHMRVCEEDNICSLLIKGVGHFPGEQSIATVLEVSQQNSELQEVTQLVLAKLNHAPSRQAQLDLFASGSAFTRYMAVLDLLYINDISLASFAKSLLKDKAVAVTIGTPYDESHRRVCDQAVDTLVQLLALTPSFLIAAETIYSDAQIAEVSSLVP